MDFPKNSPFTPTDETWEVGQKAIKDFNTPKTVDRPLPNIQRIRDAIQSAMSLCEHDPQTAIEHLSEALDLLRKT